MAQIQVGNDTIQVNGRNISLENLVGAEAYYGGTDILRFVVIFTIGCLAPIIAMAAVVQAVVEYELMAHPRLWFGPLAVGDFRCSGCFGRSRCPDVENPGLW